MSEAPAPTKPAPTFKIGDRVTVGTENPIVGTITDTRLHSSGKWTQYCVVRPNPNGGNMTHWVKDVALTHARSIREMIDADIAAAQQLGAAPATLVETPRQLTPDEYAAMFVTKTDDAKNAREEECPKCGRLLPIKDIGDHEGNGIVYGACWFCGDDPVDLIAAANQRILEAESRAAVAEQYADAETKRADKLERELTLLQNLVIAGQPITMTNVAPVKECVRYKTVAQQLLGYPEDLNRADAELASLENEGWEQVNVSYVGNQDGADTRYVMFKRVDSAPAAPQPERTTSASATPAAILTGDHVRAERMKQGFEQQVIEHPVTLNSAPATASEVLRNYREIFNQFTPEEVSANLDRIAQESALANHYARVANQPDYSPRPLLLSVVVPS